MVLNDRDKLLLYCIQLEPQSTVADCFQDMNNKQWEELLTRSKALGVEPILAANLSKMDEISIPDEIRSQVRNIYMFNVAQNMRIYHLIKEVLSLFVKHQIETILLKGSQLSYFIYENFGQRTMVDVDLMVKKSDLIKAEKELLGIGFKTQRKFDIKTESSIHHHIPPLFREGGNVPIELHWMIVYPNAPFAIDVNDIWEHSEEVSIEGNIVRTLSVADLLLMLSIHCAYHDRFVLGLRTLCDIAAVIRHNETNLIWDDLVEKSRAWKADKCLFMTLSLAKKYVGANVPETVLEKLKPEDMDQEYFDTAEDRIFALESGYSYLPPQLARLWGSDSPEKRVSSFWQQAFPSPGTSEPLYRRLFVYYPLRTRDLISRYGDSAWKLIKGDKGKREQAYWENKGNQLVDWLGNKCC